MTVRSQLKLAFIDCFPECILPSCPRSGDGHSHILPHQQTVLDCTTKYLYCQGGVGSGKTLPLAIKAVYLSCTIPNNKGVVCRLHYDDLFDSSWREVMACLQRLVEKGLIPEPNYSKKVQGQYTQIDLWNGSEMKAVQGKNWQRALGANHGWAWPDDAMELEEEFFIGTNTSAGLLSRLRLPHVHFDKRTYDEVNRPHGSLHCMVSSNPPPYDHWLHKLFGDKPGIHKLGEDTITWVQTPTTDNPFVGADYAKGLVAIQHRMGHNDHTIQRVIFGRSIPAYKGIPVYPQFDIETHVAPLVFKPELPLIRSWDFGHAHPAVTFSNIYRCQENINHYFTLSEIADARECTVYVLYDKYVKPHTDALYSRASRICDAGDKAGFRQSSSNRDSRSDMKILIAEYHIPFRWRSISLEPSLQYMRSLLQPKKPCKCGLPLILISEKCPVLIEALQGGYHFSKSRSGVVSEKPVEDKLFADVACAWRYGAENYVKWGVSWNESKFTDDTRQPIKVSHTSELNTFSWLNDSDAAFLKRLGV